VDESRSLKSDPSRTEAVLGAVFLILSLLVVIPGTIRFVVSPKAGMEFLPALGLYLIMVFVISRQFVEPYLIGRKLEKVLRRVG
jgi:hypothetical protein